MSDLGDAVVLPPHSSFRAAAGAHHRFTSSSTAAGQGKLKTGNLTKAGQAGLPSQHATCKSYQSGYSSQRALDFGGQMGSSGAGAAWRWRRTRVAPHPLVCRPLHPCTMAATIADCPDEVLRHILELLTEDEG